MLRRGNICCNAIMISMLRFMAETLVVTVITILSCHVMGWKHYHLYHVMLRDGEIG
jgi:hypothetical protein